MKIFGFEIKRAKPSIRQARSYAAAKVDRFTADWLTSGNLIADEILRWQLPKLRERSRDLWMNNDYAKNFGRKLKTNVIGPNGIGFQSKARLKNGNLDKRANQQIEEAWAKWTKRQYASICGTMSFKDICNIALESTARDGEVIIRKIKTLDNPFGFTLQILEADHLDITLNQELPNGNTIRLGIEKNSYGKPIAYHLFEKHPGNNSAAQRRVRIPADEVIHLFVKERPSQSRGIPWTHTAILKLRQLGAYEEAAVLNARVGASRMGFIIPPEGSEYIGDAKDALGNTITEVEPGSIETLMAGSDFKEFTAQYPNGEFPTFTKAMLRGVASGIGCSYNSLANDLENVNFSSLRSGLLEERDAWKVVQQWFIEHFINEVYSAWLEMAILTRQINYPDSDLERLNAPKWQPRTWEWVDPLKDIEARIEALNAGLTTRTAICAEQGIDFEEIIEQLKEEQEMLQAAGIILNQKNQEQKPQQSHADGEETIAGGSNGKNNKSW